MCGFNSCYPCLKNKINKFFFSKLDIKKKKYLKYFSHNDKLKKSNKLLNLVIFDKYKYKNNQLFFYFNKFKLNNNFYFHNELKSFNYNLNFIRFLFLINNCIFFIIFFKSSTFLLLYLNIWILNSKMLNKYFLNKKYYNFTFNNLNLFYFNYLFL